MATREMVRITQWLNPDSVFMSGRGMVTHLKWLKGERERVLKDPTRKAEIRHRHGQDGEGVALFVNDVATCSTCVPPVHSSECKKASAALGAR
jgi:hypothetical protein